VRRKDRGLVEAPTFGATAPPLPEKPQVNPRIAYLDPTRLKATLRPMRGLKRDRTASVVIRGHAFIQNLRRGHYELGVDARPGLTIAAAFDELALVV
jgi:hypothetical protein